MVKSGKFITFEGGEGTGKSTQTHLLANYLRKKDILVTVTREPGGSAGAELIRGLLVNGAPNRWSPMAEVLLLYAARLDHWEKIILPALQKGQWIICDRFSDSTLAYQGYGHGLNLNFLTTLSAEILPLSTPDLTYVFDLDPSIGIQRSLERCAEENRFEHMSSSFHHKLRQGYLKIAENNPERCQLIQAQNSVDAVHAQICKLIEPLVLLHTTAL